MLSFQPVATYTMAQKKTTFPYRVEQRAGGVHVGEARAVVPAVRLNDRLVPETTVVSF